MSVWDNTLARFKTHLQQSGLAQNTVIGYVHDVEGFSLWLAEWAGQEVSPAFFSSDDVEAYKQYLRDTLGRSPTSINRYLQSLRRFGSFAHAAGFRDTNPAQEVPLLEVPVASTPRTLAELEVQRLLEVAQARDSSMAARDYAILQLLLQTGIRVSELVRLQLADVDLIRADSACLACLPGPASPDRSFPSLAG